VDGGGVSAVLPQTVVERIFAFMAMEKTGRVELDFKDGRLLSFKVMEFVRVGTEVAGADCRPLDDRAALFQDSDR
jgi:hypothetical protein